jgi:hypothetical protein
VPYYQPACENMITIREEIGENPHLKSYSVMATLNFLCAMLLRSIAHSIICTVWLFRGKMHSDWFNRIEILQGRWQHGEKVEYFYPSGLEKTLFKWDIYVPLVMKGLRLFLKFGLVWFICSSIQSHM